MLIYILLILILIMIIVIVCVYWYYAQHDNNEQFDNSFVGFDKMINLYTTIGGATYVLAVVPRVECKNISNTNGSYNDCISNVLVLEEYENHLKSVKKTRDMHDDAEKLCEYKHKIACERHVAEKKEQDERDKVKEAHKDEIERSNIFHKDITTIHRIRESDKKHEKEMKPEHERKAEHEKKSEHERKPEHERKTEHEKKSEHEKFDNILRMTEAFIESFTNHHICDKPPVCAVPRGNKSEFRLIPLDKHHNPKSTDKLYKLIGRVQTEDMSFIRNSVSTAGEFASSDMVCLDGGTQDNAPHSSVEVIDVAGKGGEPAVMLRLQVQATLGGKHYMHDKNGNPVMEYKYIGVCSNKTCLYEGNNVKRLCLYDKEDNPFVLHFTMKNAD